MIAIIAGGRDYRLGKYERTFLDELLAQYHFTHVIHGDQQGADRGGAFWAKRRGLKVTPYPANWARFKKKAGPLRNEKMASIANLLIAFPGGHGTNDMIDRAYAHGLEIVYFPF